MSLNQSEALKKLKGKSGPTATRLGLLFRTRQSIARKIMHLAEMPVDESLLEWDRKEMSIAPDPVVRTCREISPRAFGRLGLFYPDDFEAPRFSRLIRNHLLDPKFEEHLACVSDMYGVDMSDRYPWIPGVIFTSSDEMFVYTTLEVQFPCSMVRLASGQKLRFIYSLRDLFVTTRLGYDPNTRT